MAEPVNDNYDDEEGELAIVFGDFYIPNRKQDIPQQFKDLILPNKVQHAICTGNIGSSKEINNWIKTLAQNVYIVKGDQDEKSEQEEQISFNIGNFKFSLINGYQVVPWGIEEGIYNQLRDYDSDIYISGYTHEQKVTKFEQKHFLNPGSISGAYSALKKDPLPSFIILEIKEKQVDAYLYQLQNDEVKIKKTSINK